jgi:hypothetical protein
MLRCGSTSVSSVARGARQLDFLRDLWQTSIRPRSQEVSMVREFQLLTVGFVFMFLGAIVVGVLH